MSSSSGSYCARDGITVLPSTLSRLTASSARQSSLGDYFFAETAVLTLPSSLEQDRCFRGGDSHLTSRGSSRIQFGRKLRNSA